MAQQFLGDLPGALRDLGDVALLELWHAAALRVNHAGLDAVVGQDRACRHANVRVVVVDEAGRVEHRLSSEARRLPVYLRRLFLVAQSEGAAVELR